MDIWKYYDITHKKHVLLNPMSTAKFEGLLSLLNLKENCKVLDIGCGKGEPLKKMTKPDGLIIIGEPYWLKESDKKYLKMSEIKKYLFAHFYIFMLGKR